MADYNWASVKVDKKRLLELEREAPGRAHEAMGKVTTDFVADVIDHFSPNSPSEPGQPPAVDTGYLKNHIVVQPIKQGVWRALFATDYIDDLEFGTVHMAARPSILPGLIRMEKRAPATLISLVLRKI